MLRAFQLSRPYPFGCEPAYVRPNATGGVAAGLGDACGGAAAGVGDVCGMATGLGEACGCAVGLGEACG